MLASSMLIIVAIRGAPFDFQGGKEGKLGSDYFFIFFTPQMYDFFCLAWKLEAL